MSVAALVALAGVPLLLVSLVARPWLPQWGAMATGGAAPTDSVPAGDVLERG
jgi:hypothetical protein